MAGSSELKTEPGNASQHRSGHSRGGVERYDLLAASTTLTIDYSRYLFIDIVSAPVLSGHPIDL